MAGDILQRIKSLAGDEYREVKSCVLAYSGGVDSNAMALLLQELGISVITVSLDLGAGMEKARKNAKEVSSKSHFFDAREEFLAHIKKGVWANTLHSGYINGEGMSRPLIAKYLVQVAEKEGCQAIAHGSSGSGNDQFRMENSIRVLAPDLRVIAPIRDWNLSREESVSIVQKKLPGSKPEGKSPFSVDENLWCRAVRYGGISKESSFKVPKEAYSLTCDQSSCPSSQAEISLVFQDGFPVQMSVAGQKGKYSGVELFSALNKIAGANGIGRLNLAQDKLIGLKAHEAFECPAAVAVSFAHRSLESLVLTSSELEAKSGMERKWAKLVHEGGWYTRLRHALEKFMGETQIPVEGEVSLSLCKGGLELTGMDSQNKLYDERLTSRGKEAAFDQRDSRAFAKLWGLQDGIAYRVKH